MIIQNIQSNKQALGLMITDHSNPKALSYDETAAFFRPNHNMNPWEKQQIKNKKRNETQDTNQSGSLYWLYHAA